MVKITGWGTWIRTKIDGVRVRSSTVELSPSGRFPHFRREAVAGLNSEARALAQGFARLASPRASRKPPPPRLHMLDRHHPRRRFQGPGDRGADGVAARQADFDLAPARAL